MALTISRAFDMNSFGNKKQDTFTVTGDTAGAVVTRLNWIDHVQVTEPTQTDMLITAHPNSATASTTEDDPGQVYLEAIDAGVTYRVVCTGR